MSFICDVLQFASDNKSLANDKQSGDRTRSKMMTRLMQLQCADDPK